MICEHGNEITPAQAKAFCNMPAAWYARVAKNLNPDVCIFTSGERVAIESVAKKAKG